MIFGTFRRMNGFRKGEAKAEGSMRRHVLTRTAVLGSFLAFSACDDADTLGGNDTKELVKTASTEQRAPNAEPGNGKAWMFTTPREARILLLATP